MAFIIFEQEKKWTVIHIFDAQEIRMFNKKNKINKRNDKQHTQKRSWKYKKKFTKSPRFQIKINDVDFCLFIKRMLDNEEKADFATKEREREEKKPSINYKLSNRVNQLT